MVIKLSKVVIERGDMVIKLYEVIMLQIKWGNQGDQIKRGGHSYQIKLVDTISNPELEVMTGLALSTT